MDFLKRKAANKDQRPEDTIDTIEVLPPPEVAQGDLFDPHTVRLVKYDAAKRALAEAHSVDEVKDIRDKAKAVKIYARLKDDTELIDHATAIQKRAEIRIGELLIDMDERGERHSGHGDQKTGSQAATRNCPIWVLPNRSLRVGRARRACRRKSRRRLSRAPSARPGPNAKRHRRHQKTRSKGARPR